MSKSASKKGSHPRKKGSRSSNTSATSSPTNSKSHDEKVKSTKANVPPPDDESRIFTRFVWIGDKTHSRTPIYFHKLSLPQLLEKVDLDLFTAPPSGQEIFEIYFKEDIFPFIRHGIQSKINNKKDIAKLWEVQSNTLQKIYCDRSNLLKEEWSKKMKSKQLDANSHLTAEEKAAIRKKAEQKAKNEAAKLRRKEQMERLISSGAFDEPSTSKSSDKNKSSKGSKAKKAKKSEEKECAKSHKSSAKKTEQKKEDQNKKSKSKASKVAKKKKAKKWKDKKSKNQSKSSTELWPAMKSKAKPSPKTSPETKQLAPSSNGISNLNTNALNGSHSSIPQPIRNGVDRNVDSNQNGLNLNSTHHPPPNLHSVHHHPAPLHHGSLPQHNGYHGHSHSVHPQYALQERHRVEGYHRNERERMMNHRKMVKSHLRFKLVVRSESEEYVVESGPNIHRQMDGLRVFMDAMQSVNELHWIKIWIFVDLNVVQGQDLWLSTDREQVNITLNQSKLFEILWTDFGHAVKRRIDSPNIKTVFVKKTNALRLKIPFYSL